MICARAVASAIVTPNTDTDTVTPDTNTITPDTDTATPDTNTVTPDTDRSYQFVLVASLHAIVDGNSLSSFSFHPIN